MCFLWVFGVAQILNGPYMNLSIGNGRILHIKNQNIGICCSNPGLKICDFLQAGCSCSFQTRDGPMFVYQSFLTIIFGRPSK